MAAAPPSLLSLVARVNTLVTVFCVLSAFSSSTLLRLFDSPLLSSASHLSLQQTNAVSQRSLPPALPNKEAKQG
jgi:hypothetical protein